jgi:hypothetical protein
MRSLLGKLKEDMNDAHDIMTFRLDRDRYILDADVAAMAAKKLHQISFFCFLRGCCVPARIFP